MTGLEVKPQLALWYEQNVVGKLAAGLQEVGLMKSWKEGGDVSIPLDLSLYSTNKYAKSDLMYCHRTALMQCNQLFVTQPDSVEYN